jgi:hypothetical protein
MSGSNGNALNKQEWHHWKPLTIDGQTSPTYDPLEYPRPEKTPQSPSMWKVRYKVSPSPPQEENFNEAIRSSFKGDLKRNFSGLHPNTPTLIDPATGELQLPKVSLVSIGSEIMVDILFPKARVAAAFSLYEKEFVVKGCTFTKVCAGLCHHPKYITMKLLPDRRTYGNGNSISAQEYHDAITYFLSEFRQMTFIGAWRSFIRHSDNSEQPASSVKLVVKVPLEFQPETLPGYINDQGRLDYHSQFEGKDNNEVVVVYTSDGAYFDNSVWFYLAHGYRRNYCRNCYTTIHDSNKICPLIECNICTKVGHIAANCPEAERSN